MNKDSQRSKALGALQACKTALNPYKFQNLESLQAYLDKMVATRWFVRRWQSVAGLGVTVKPLKLRAGTMLWEDVTIRRLKYNPTMFPIVYMPENEMDELTVLHLVAHCLQPTDGHGRLWANTLLTLTRYRMGKYASDEIKRQFRSRRLKYFPKRVLTPIALAAARYRAAKAFKKELTGE